MTSDESTVHERIAQGLKDHPAKKGVLFNVVVTIVEVGGGIALFHLARSMGASNVVAYLIGGLGPVIGGFVIWARARKFSGASASIFAFAMVSALIAVLVGSSAPKALLYKDCAATAVVGLIFLGSGLVARKPVVFYMAQRYATDGTHDGMAVFDTMWDAYHDFRVGIRVSNYYWAGLFLVQASGTAWIVYRSSYSTGYNFSQVLPLVATGLGIVGSIAIGRHYAKKGRARAPQANR